MFTNFIQRSGASNARILIAGSFIFIALLLAGIGFASGSGSNWSIVSSPNVTFESTNYSSVYIKATTCASASECWAVGYFFPPNQGSAQAFIEEWNGTAWTVANSPAINSYSVSLNDVRCASSSDCWAVGSFLDPNTSSDKTLIEHWDGAAWSVVASPNTSSPQYNVLFAVTCASGSNCWAVGYSDNGPLIEHWNGTAWTIASAPTAGGGFNNFLNDVVCNSASDCWAAGRYFGSTSPPGYKTLLEHWDGTVWSIVASPNGDPSKFTDNYLNGITCTSSSNCWTVGYVQNMSTGGYGTLVEHWDGNAWSMVNSPSTTPVAQPQRVSCASASDCWMVGNFGGNTLTEHWDGNSWSLVSSPDADPTQGNRLYGVFCLAGNNCWAAGEYSNFQANANQSLVEHWNGASWSIVPSDNPNSTVENLQENQLQGTACASPTDCWAVGFIRNGPYTTLIQHWDGNQWSVVQSPNTSSWFNILNGVTCNSTSDCWAAGYLGGGSGTLLEHWDGSNWSIIPSANTSAPTNILYNVACASPTQCWAVGFTGSVGSYATLLEHWNGSSWTVAASVALPGAKFASLNGVTCSSPSQCWAVGEFQDIATSNYHTLIEKWNGTSWTGIASVDPGPPNTLSGVACASASDCWTVGSYFNGFTSQMLFEHWNGTSWSLVPRTSNSSLQESLSSIACVSSSQCWAAGYNSVLNGTHHPLIANWNGVSWAATPVPELGSNNNDLYAIACTSDAHCWSSGTYSNGSEFDDQTLIEGYSPSGTPSYTISVNPSSVAVGFTDGGGRYLSGADLTVTATPNNGSKFLNWSESGNVVSTSLSYEFTLSADRNLVANFIPPVATPTISPNSGTFKGKVVVKMSCATTGAKIYYTTDGSVPTTSSSLYPTPVGKKKFKGITISGKGLHTVKAIAVAPGFSDSQVAMAFYTIK